MRENILNIGIKTVTGQVKWSWRWTFIVGCLCVKNTTGGPAGCVKQFSKCLQPSWQSRQTHQWKQSASAAEEARRWFQKFSDKDRQMETSQCCDVRLGLKGQWLRLKVIQIIIANALIGENKNRHRSLSARHPWKSAGDERYFLRGGRVPPSRHTCGGAVLPPSCLPAPCPWEAPHTVSPRQAAPGEPCTVGLISAFPRPFCHLLAGQDVDTRLSLRWCWPLGCWFPFACRRWVCGGGLPLPPAVVQPPCLWQKSF